MQSANIHIITTSYKLIGSDPAAKEIACLPFKGVVYFKKKIADNLLTPMSSKISMSFFLQSKRNESF